MDFAPWRSASAHLRLRSATTTQIHKTRRDAAAQRAEEARRDQGTEVRATEAGVREDMLTSTSTHEQRRVTVSSCGQSDICDT